MSESSFSSSPTFNPKNFFSNSFKTCSSLNNLRIKKFLQKKEKLKF